MPQTPRLGGPPESWDGWHRDQPASASRHQTPPKSTVQLQRKLSSFIGLIGGCSKTFRQDEVGQALLELALGVPVLLLIMMGICTFGIAINNYLLLTAATSSGARTLALNRGVTTDPCLLVSNTVAAATPLLKPASLTYSLAITPSGGGQTANYYGSTCTAAVLNLTANATARVTVAYPCTLKFMGQNFAAVCSLQAVDAELVQ